MTLWGLSWVPSSTMASPTTRLSSSPVTMDPNRRKAGTVPAARMWMGGDSRAVRVSCSKVVCACLEQSCGQDISKLARLRHYGKLHGYISNCHGAGRGRTAVAPGDNCLNGRIIDGKSMLPVLTGATNRSQHDVFLHYCGFQILARVYGR